MYVVCELLSKLSPKETVTQEWINCGMFVFFSKSSQRETVTQE